MDKATLVDSLRRIDPFLRTDILSKDEVDFGIAMCHRFGRVRHYHAWHRNNRYHTPRWQTFDQDKFDDVIGAKSWLEVIEILQ